MDASAIAAMVPMLNAMPAEARQGVLASMNADARTQLLSDGVNNDLQRSARRAAD
jgi:hypothetical protein